MKRCPECNRTYSDETLAFCLADGALLSAPYEPEATQRLPPPRITSEAPTEVLPADSSIPTRLRAPGRSRFIYAAVIVVFITAVGIAVLLRSEFQRPDSTDKAAVPTPKSAPAPSPGDIGATPTPEIKTDVSHLSGTYSLFLLEKPSSGSVGKMTLAVRPGNEISVQGKGWKGTGRTDGQQGYYDWKFEDGKYGRTTFVINSNGTLQGHVFGSGLDWWYLARRSKQK